MMQVYTIQMQTRETIIAIALLVLLFYIAYKVITYNNLPNCVKDK